MSTAKFTTLQAAIDYRYGCNDFAKWAIVHGEDGLYWIVTVRQSRKYDTVA